MFLKASTVLTFHRHNTFTNEWKREHSSEILNRKQQPDLYHIITSCYILRLATQITDKINHISSFAAIFHKGVIHNSTNRPKSNMCTATLKSLPTYHTTLLYNVFNNVWKINYDGETGTVTAEVRMRGSVRSRKPFPRKFHDRGKKKKSMNASLSAAWKESGAHPPSSTHRRGHPDPKEKTFPESQTLFVFFVALQWWVASKVHFSHCSRTATAQTSHSRRVFVAQRVAKNLVSGHNKCLHLSREGFFFFMALPQLDGGIHVLGRHPNPPSLPGLQRIALLL